MKISHIKITNILGIDDLEFSPEGFTAITGPNGVGKTSILEAIKSATGQGHDATLLRKGAEKGEVVLVLDDGTEIKQRVTASTTTRDVVKDGKKVTKPGAVIKALTDALSVNPVEFLTARKQDRVQVLLESMPLQLDADRLTKISGIPVDASSQHALHVIEAVRKTVYDDRTGTNRAIKEKEATINQLRVALPDAPGGVEGDEDDLRSRLDQAKFARDSEINRIDAKLSGIQVEHEKKVSAMKAAAQEKIDAIRAELEAAIDAERAALQKTSETAARVRQKAVEAYLSASHPLQAAIDAIAANRSAAAKRQATLETIRQMDEELGDLQADAKRQTDALAAIEAYKSELLKSLPIPGIEVVDGELYRDGVPFDRLNTAQRVGIAFEVAKLRAGDLRLVCLDGMELLDSESLVEMRKQAEAGGVQVFITRVQEHGHKLEVRTE